MKIVVITPQSLSIMFCDRTKTIEDDFELIAEYKNKDISLVPSSYYHIIKMENPEKIDWDEKLNLIYSPDRETRTLILDMLKMYENSESLESM